jgi:hypothetical protein
MPASGAVTVVREGYASAVASEEVWKLTREHAARNIERLAAQARCKGGRVTTVLAEGSPAAAITRTANGQAPPGQTHRDRHTRACGGSCSAGWRSGWCAYRLLSRAHRRRSSSLIRARRRPREPQSSEPRVLEDPEPRAYA